MVSSRARMSLETSPADRPCVLAFTATSRVRSRRLIWLGPVPSRTPATWLRRTMRALPSALLPVANGSRSRSAGALRASGASRTLTS
jgi:hypothetical protein